MALGYQNNPLGRKPQNTAVDDMLLRVVRGRETSDPLAAALDDPIQAALIEARTFPLPDPPRFQATPLDDPIQAVSILEASRPQAVPLEDPTPAIEDTETPSITDIMLAKGEQQATIADIPLFSDKSPVAAKKVAAGNAVPGARTGIDTALPQHGGGLSPVSAASQKGLAKSVIDSAATRAALKQYATYLRIQNAETGSVEDPFIRTKFAPRLGSSAYGPSQITRGLLRDSLDKIDYTPAEREFANHMIDRQTLALRFGYNPNSKSSSKDDLWRKFQKAFPKASKAEFKELQYGGNLGILRNEEDKATYQSIAKKLFNQQITQFDKAKKPYSVDRFTDIAEEYNLTIQDVKAALVWHQGLNKALASNGWKWLKSRGGKAYLQRMSKA